MYLLELAMKTLVNATMKASLADAPRFLVTSCPWLKGRIMRWSQGGVTVRYDIPNVPWDNDHTVIPKDDPASHTSSYTTNMCISPKTEVTAL